MGKFDLKSEKLLQNLQQMAKELKDILGDHADTLVDDSVLRCGIGDDFQNKLSLHIAYMCNHLMSAAQKRERHAKVTEFLKKRGFELFSNRNDVLEAGINIYAASYTIGPISNERWHRKNKYSYMNCDAAFIYTVNATTLSFIVTKTRVAFIKAAVTQYEELATLARIFYLQTFDICATLKLLEAFIGRHSNKYDVKIGGERR